MNQRCGNCEFWERRDKRGLNPKYWNQGLCKERADVIATYEHEGEDCLDHEFKQESPGIGDPESMPEFTGW